MIALAVVGCWRLLDGRPDGDTRVDQHRS